MAKGKKVGKYELGKTLGSGAFSKVKLGLDDRGKQFAVKIIDKEQLVKEHMEEQLKREISIMRTLNHPHIVRLFDVLQTTNNIYLVLELVTGGELFDRIVSAKRFNEDTARRYFQQIVIALHFCHKQGIAHRDLKPENLLVDDKDNIKITDFGLASLQGPAEKSQLLRTVCGTPNYVAPEVLKEKGYVGSFADVWSCGVILFVMMAGYLPFDDPQLNTLFAKIERGEYRMCKGFSDGAKDLVEKMLQVDPSKRPSLDQVMAHPWFVKNWDRTVFDGLNGTTLTPDLEHAWQRKTINEKDPLSPSLSSISGPLEDSKSQVWGAFDLITQLSMTTLSTLATNRPVIKIFTRFINGQSSADTLASLTDVLTKLNASPKLKDDSNQLELRGFVNKTKGLLTYTVSLSPLVGGSLTMVEVRRGRGDTFDFHDLYRALMAGLGDSVRSEEVTKGEVGEQV